MDTRGTVNAAAAERRNENAARGVVVGDPGHLGVAGAARARQHVGDGPGRVWGDLPRIDQTILGVDQVVSVVSQDLVAVRVGVVPLAAIGGVTALDAGSVAVDIAVTPEIEDRPPTSRERESAVRVRLDITRRIHQRLRRLVVQQTVGYGGGGADVVRIEDGEDRAARRASNDR